MIPLNWNSLWLMILSLGASGKGRERENLHSKASLGILNSMALTWLLGTPFIKSSLYLATKCLLKPNTWPLKTLWHSDWDVSPQTMTDIVGTEQVLLVKRKCYIQVCRRPGLRWHLDFTWQHGSCEFRRNFILHSSTSNCQWKIHSHHLEIQSFTEPN